MHSKKKGNIGQLATAFYLAKLGFSVFTEEGDISKIDLIVEKNNKLVTFQCKALTSKNGILEVPLRKTGPNYVVRYNSKMFDFFSVYDLVNDKLYFIPSSILESHVNTFRLRLKKTKINYNSRYAEDFVPEKIMKEYLDDSGI